MMPAVGKLSSAKQPDEDERRGRHLACICPEITKSEEHKNDKLWFLWARSDLIHSSFSARLPDSWKSFSANGQEMAQRPTKTCLFKLSLPPHTLVKWATLSLLNSELWLFLRHWYFCKISVLVYLECNYCMMLLIQWFPNYFCWFELIFVVIFFLFRVWQGPVFMCEWFVQTNALGMWSCQRLWRWERWEKVQ